jgi:hypothetical protein
MPQSVLIHCKLLCGYLVPHLLDPLFLVQVDLLVKSGKGGNLHYGFYDRRILFYYQLDRMIAMVLPPICS